MTAVPARVDALPGEPTRPRRYRVARRHEETADTVTLELEPVDAPIAGARAGQFTMLYVFGAGEVPISISGLPGHGELLAHTIRAVGAATTALCALEEGEMLGVRGPFGSDWGVEGCAGRSVVVIAGGIGLAPLRPVVSHLLAHRDDFDRVALLVGARTPRDLLFVDDLESWRGRFDVDVEVTVDAADPGWHGDVGVVTDLLPRITLPPATTAMVCGPEIMMRFTARALADRGVPAANVRVSLERNMQCAIRQCGHCQLGPRFVCADGPVFDLSAVEALLEVRDL